MADWKDEAIEQQIRPILEILAEVDPEFSRIELFGWFSGGIEHYYYRVFDARGQQVLLKPSSRVHERDGEIESRLASFRSRCVAHNAPWAAVFGKVEQGGEFELGFDYDDPYKFHPNRGFLAEHGLLGRGRPSKAGGLGGALRSLFGGSGADSAAPKEREEVASSFWGKMAIAQSIDPIVRMLKLRLYPGASRIDFLSWLEPGLMMTWHEGRDAAGGAIRLEPCAEVAECDRETASLLESFWGECDSHKAAWTVLACRVDPAGEFTLQLENQEPYSYRFASLRKWFEA